MPICMRMCAIRLDEACDMNMDTGAGTATRDASQTCGEWGQGRREKEEGEGERGEGINCGQTAQCMQRVVAAYYACHRLFDLCNSLVAGGR